MHTKPRHLERLISGTKHWAFNINPDPQAFKEKFLQTDNYENLLTEAEIDSEISRIHSFIPKLSYGEQDVYPKFLVRAFLESGSCPQLVLDIQSPSLDELKEQIYSFKKDYRNSIFKVTGISTYKQESERDYQDLEAHLKYDINSLFSDILNYESYAYRREEIFLNKLHEVDMNICSLTKNSPIMFSLIQLTSVLYVAIFIVNLYKQHYGVAALWVAFTISYFYTRWDDIFIKKRELFTKTLLNELNVYKVYKEKI